MSNFRQIIDHITRKYLDGQPDEWTDRPYYRGLFRLPPGSMLSDGHKSNTIGYTLCYLWQSDMPFSLMKKKLTKFTGYIDQRCSVKKEFLKISQNSQENTCARVSFLSSTSNGSSVKHENLFYFKCYIRFHLNYLKQWYESEVIWVWWPTTWLREVLNFFQFLWLTWYLILFLTPFFESFPSLTDISSLTYFLFRYHFSFILKAWYIRWFDKSTFTESIKVFPSVKIFDYPLSCFFSMM